MPAPSLPGYRNSRIGTISRRIASTASGRIAPTAVGAEAAGAARGLAGGADGAPVQNETVAEIRALFGRELPPKLRLYLRGVLEIIDEPEAV